MPPQKSPLFVILGCAGAIALVVGLWAMSGPGDFQANEPGGAPRPAPSDVSPPQEPAHQPAPARPAKTQATSDFKRLEGAWLRTDGQYVLEIRRAGPDGSLEAEYLNPRPIHVAKAQATSEEDKVKVFVELRDAGYPGCTYHLVYDADRNCLAGTYYQAAAQETYEVVFERAP